MPNIPSKPIVQNQEWINGETKLNQTNLTAGVNNNITNLKTSVDGLIDALGGPGAAAPGGTKLYRHFISGAGDSDLLGGMTTSFDLIIYNTVSDPYTMETFPRLFEGGPLSPIISDHYSVDIGPEYIYNPLLKRVDDGEGGYLYKFYGIGAGESTDWAYQLRSDTLSSVTSIHDVVTLK